MHREPHSGSLNYTNVADTTAGAGTGLNTPVDHSDDAVELSLSPTALSRIDAAELVHERLRRFLKLVPDLLTDERAEAVHDLRVWSRRLQQVLATMFPRVPEDRAGSVVRTLRQARRGLSEWRDCDVLLALLERRLKRLRNADEQLAWQLVRAYLVERRKKEVGRARRRLERRKVFTLAQRIDQLLTEPGNDQENDIGPAASLVGRVAKSIGASYGGWRAALARAAESGSQTDAHYFRIKTKQLRYRIELARDLGDKQLLSPLRWLKALQDGLGRCRDRVELARRAVDAVADTAFVLSAPRPAGRLFKRLARDLSAETAKVKSLLLKAMDSSELSPLESWLTNQHRQANE